jgi:hypothetical protein
MDKTQLTPEQQIAWAQGNSSLQYFFVMLPDAMLPGKYYGNTEISLCIANLIRNGEII